MSEEKKERPKFRSRGQRLLGDTTPRSRTPGSDLSVRDKENAYSSFGIRKFSGSRKKLDKLRQRAISGDWIEDVAANSMSGGGIAGFDPLLRAPMLRRIITNIKSRRKSKPPVIEGYTYFDLMTLLEAMSGKQKKKLYRHPDGSQVIDDHPGADVIHHENDVTVYRLKDQDAASDFGSGSTLCTAPKDNNHFHNYMNHGPIDFIHAGHERYQIHFPSGQLQHVRKEDGKAINVSPEELTDKHPELKNVKAWHKFDLNTGSRSIQMKFVPIHVQKHILNDPNSDRNSKIAVARDGDKSIFEPHHIEKESAIEHVRLEAIRNIDPSHIEPRHLTDDAIGGIAASRIPIEKVTHEHIMDPKHISIAHQLIARLPHDKVRPEYLNHPNRDAAAEAMKSISPEHIQPHHMFDLNKSQPFREKAAQRIHPDKLTSDVIDKISYDDHNNVSRHIAARASVSSFSPHHLTHPSFEVRNMSAQKISLDKLNDNHIEGITDPDHDHVVKTLIGRMGKSNKYGSAKYLNHANPNLAVHAAETMPAKHITREHLNHHDPFVRSILSERIPASQFKPEDIFGSDPNVSHEAINKIKPELLNSGHMLQLLNHPEGQRHLTKMAMDIPTKNMNDDHIAIIGKEYPNVAGLMRMRKGM